MRRSTFAVVLSCLVLFAAPCVSPAWAQQEPADSSSTPIADAVVATTQVTSQPAFMPRPVAQKRPAVLLGLYTSFVALQIGDAVSTFKALDAGGVEANPMMKGIASNKGAMFAMKASASLGTIYLTEKLWKKNRVAAVATMVIMNGAYAAIVTHNAKLAGK